MLGVANPKWKAFADECEVTGQRPRTNPDGDVALEGVDYNSFIVPPCPTCALEGEENSVVSIRWRYTFYVGLI
jgi:NAD-dependent deacetylase sirtuin 4